MQTTFILAVFLAPAVLSNAAGSTGDRFLIWIKFFYFMYIIGMRNLPAWFYIVTIIFLLQLFLSLSFRSWAKKVVFLERWIWWSDWTVERVSRNETCIWIRKADYINPILLDSMHYFITVPTFKGLIVNVMGQNISQKMVIGAGSKNNLADCWRLKN